MLFAIPLVVGAAVGYLTRGRLRNLANLPLRSPWLLWAGLAVQLMPYLGLLKGASEERLLVSYLLIAVWLALTAYGATQGLRAGILVLTVGWALNLAVIASNHGAMPVERVALAKSGASAITARAITRGQIYKHRSADASSALRLLDDRIAIRPLTAVISIGDILLLVGITAVMATAMRPVRSSRTTHGLATCNS